MHVCDAFMYAHAMHACVCAFVHKYRYTYIHVHVFVNVSTCIYSEHIHTYIPGAGLVAVYNLNGSFLLYLDLNAAHAADLLLLFN